MTIAYSGDSITFPDTSIQTSAAESGIVPILATVATNALTITLQPTPLQFRSATLGSGAVTKTALASNITLIVPATATLGTINAVQSRLIVLAINNAGTVELAVVNVAGGNNLDETTVINTTAIAAGSNTANVIYSTTARTGVPFRVVGYVESTQATAGTWATAPSTVQGKGGNASADMGSLGYGQTWQNLTASRAIGTIYYNTTGKPISIVVNITYNPSVGVYNYYVNGVVVAITGFGGASFSSATTLVIPSGNTYQVLQNGGVAGSLTSWYELR